jgi:hypothetical protein
MRMNRKAALAAGASFGMAFLAACSDSSTAPTAANVVVPKSSFAVGSVTASATPQVGKVFVCKTGNVGGAFSFSRTPVGPNPDAGASVAANQTIATGTCLEVANDFSPSGSGSNLVINEAAAANTVQTVASCTFIGKDLQGNLQPPESCTYSNGGTLFFNSFHGYVIVYNNVFTPPPPPSGCTFTKGWYRNNGANTITGVDGLTTTVEAAIFAATPGKPGPVTWNFSNDVLNLYQQLLAALENGGANGPAAVKAAITQAQSLTSVSGYEITYTGDQQTLSDLITTLSNFNEGLFPNWPHC